MNYKVNVKFKVKHLYSWWMQFELRWINYVNKRLVERCCEVFELVFFSYSCGYAFWNAPQQIHKCELLKPQSICMTFRVPASTMKKLINGLEYEYSNGWETRRLFDILEKKIIFVSIVQWWLSVVSMHIRWENFGVRNFYQWRDWAFSRIRCLTWWKKSWPVNRGSVRLHYCGLIVWLHFVPLQIANLTVRRCSKSGLPKR